jgi:transcriptional regulator with XRE-family HTH domain
MWKPADAPSQLTSEVAGRVRDLRRRQRLSARALSERCIAGGAQALTRSTIAKIESGVRRFITLDEVAAFAQALGVAPHELLKPIVNVDVDASEELGEQAPESDLAMVSLGKLEIVTRDKKHELADMASRIGVSVDYFPLDSGPNTARRRRQAEALYCACGRIIESVSEQPGSRMDAVNSFIEIGNQPGDDQVEAASHRYLAALDSKIGLVPYTRIIQLYPGELARLPGGSIAELIVDNYRGHYQNMANASESPQGRELAIVEAVLAKYPISFVLAHDASDSELGGSLIWQMHEHVSGDHADSVQLTGVFIIRDPLGIITKTFSEWFLELLRSPYRYRLKPANLDPNGEA